MDQLGLDAAAAANQSLPAERDQLKQEIGQAHHDQDDALQENIRFRQLIEQLQQKVASQAQNISRLETALAAAEQAKQDLQRERDQARTDLTQSQKDLRDERAKAEKVLHDQQQTTQRQAVDLARLEAENKALNKAEQQYQTEIQRLQQAQAVTTQECMDLREKFNRADQARENAEQALAKAEQESQALANQVAALSPRTEKATGAALAQSPTRRKKAVPAA